MPVGEKEEPDSPANGTFFHFYTKSYPPGRGASTKFRRSAMTNDGDRSDIAEPMAREIDTPRFCYAERVGREGGDDAGYLALEQVAVHPHLY